MGTQLEKGKAEGAWISFLWKLLHNLLPSVDRLSRILPNSDAHCKFCPLPVIADLTHCLFLCNSTREVGSWLLSCIRHHDQSVTAPKLLKLGFMCEDSAEMPLVWIVAQSLLYMWGVRATGKIVSLANTRAVLERRISLLRVECLSEMSETTMALMVTLSWKFTGRRRTSLV